MKPEILYMVLLKFEQGSAKIKVKWFVENIDTLYVGFKDFSFKPKTESLVINFQVNKWISRLELK